MLPLILCFYSLSWNDDLQGVNILGLMPKMKHGVDFFNCFVIKPSVERLGSFFVIFAPYGKKRHITG